MCAVQLQAALFNSFREIRRTPTTLLPFLLSRCASGNSTPNQPGSCVSQRYAPLRNDVRRFFPMKLRSASSSQDCEPLLVDLRHNWLRRQDINPLLYFYLTAKSVIKVLGFFLNPLRCIVTSSVSYILSLRLYHNWLPRKLVNSGSQCTFSFIERYMRNLYKGECTYIQTDTHNTHT